MAVAAVAAVIFDFDGLLMATESTMLASWQYEWRQHGLELDTATFWADHGGDVSQERYRLLAQAVGPSYDQDRSHARRLAYRDRLHAGLDLTPGLGGWLDQATAAGMALAVASRSPVWWVRDHLTRWPGRGFRLSLRRRRGSGVQARPGRVPAGPGPARAARRAGGRGQGHAARGHRRPGRRAALRRDPEPAHRPRPVRPSPTWSWPPPPG